MSGQPISCFLFCPLLRQIWVIAQSGTDFPSGSDSEESTCSVGDLGSSTSGSGRSPGKGNGYPFQYSCLENPMDCSLPGSTVHGVLQARILEWVAIPFSRGSSQPGIEPRFPALQADSLPSKPPGKPRNPYYVPKTSLKRKAQIWSPKNGKGTDIILCLPPSKQHRLKWVIILNTAGLKVN